MKCLTIVLCVLVIGVSQVKAQAELFMGDAPAKNPFMDVYDEPAFVFVSTVQDFEGVQAPKPKPAPKPVQPVQAPDVKVDVHYHHSTTPLYTYGYRIGPRNQSAVRYGLFGRSRSSGGRAAGVLGKVRGLIGKLRLRGGC